MRAVMTMAFVQNTSDKYNISGNQALLNALDLHINLKINQSDPPKAQNIDLFIPVVWRNRQLGFWDCTNYHIVGLDRWEKNANSQLI